MIFVDRVYSKTFLKMKRAVLNAFSGFFAWDVCNKDDEESENVQQHTEFAT